MKKGLLLVVIMVLIITTGCTEQSAGTTGEMEKKIEDLEQQVSDQNSRIANLEEQFADQAFKVYMLEEGDSDRAALDPTGGSGYSKSGDFLISISNIEEYLDGCKVYLQIGNPNNAVYSGYTIQAEYGTRANYSDANFVYNEWENSLKKKEIQISTDLDRGAWNNAEIILPSIDVKDFSYLELEILTDTILLFTN